MMERERRLSDRKTLNPLPYINLPGDNGGIVLDISEQGLRFRAVAPLEQSGPILFWFTAHSNLIAGIAELAWIDETKKNGGLRFTQLPYNAREQIRKWPYESAFRSSIGQDLTLHIPAADGAPAQGKSLRGVNAPRKAADAFSLPAHEPESFEAILQETQRSIQENAPAEKHLLPWDDDSNLHRRPPVRTICAVLLVIFILAFGYLRHRQVGKWLVWAGMRISGQVTSVAAATGTSTPVPPSPPRIDTPAATAIKPAVAALNPPIPQPPASPAKAETQIEKAPAPVVAKNQPPEPPTPKPSAHGTQLIVQVAALAQEEDARKLAETLRQQNFKALVTTLPSDSLFRVTMGPYQDAASALALVAKLKKAGFQAFIRREPVSGSLGT